MTVSNSDDLSGRPFVGSAGKLIATLGKYSTRYILSEVNIGVDGLAAVRGQI